MGTTRFLWRWRRNPLRRRSDIAEGCVRLAVAASVLLGAPAAGAGAGFAIHDRLAATAEEQAAKMRPTTAVLLQDARDNPAADGLAPTGFSKTVTVRVKWQTADGTSRTGMAQVEPPRPAGSKTTVWLDAQGRMGTPPLTDGQVRAEAMALGTAAGLVTGAGLFAGGVVVLRRMERRRIDAWETEWAVTEPLWSNRPA